MIVMCRRHFITVDPTEQDIPPAIDAETEVLMRAFLDLLT